MLCENHQIRLLKSLQFLNNNFNLYSLYKTLVLLTQERGTGTAVG